MGGDDGGAVEGSEEAEVDGLKICCRRCSERGGISPVSVKALKMLVRFKSLVWIPLSFVRV